MGLKIGAGLTLDNGLRPQAIAGVAPTLDYRFARDKRETEAVSLTDKLTFTGGNQGTFVGSDGYIQRATTNVPRFDHDPVTRVSEGLLVEGSRENLVLQSEDFSTTWLRENILAFGSGSTVNAAIAPDGTVTADLITEDTTASALHRISQNLTASAGDATFSVYVKRANGARNLEINASVLLGGRAVFNLSNGTPGEVTSGTASIQNVGNGWYRCSVTGTSAGATTSAYLQLCTGTASITRTYTGDGTSGIYIWGAQVEVGTPSTYIPTTTTAVTRTADSAVIDGTGVITGTYTMVAKPEGSALVSGSTIVLQEDYTTERVMVFPAALSAAQITAIRSAM